MNGFSGKLKETLLDWKTVVPVAAASLLSFGWQLFRSNVGIDDMIRERYRNGGLFSQGRFTGPFIRYPLGLFKIFPLLELIYAILFITAAALLLIIAFDKASKGGLSKGVLTFFACAFISYPLINELFVYKGSNLNSGVGYFLTAILLLMTSGIRLGKNSGAEDPEGISEKGRKKNKFLTVLRISGAVLVSMAIVSLYEAFAAVYLVLASLYVFTEIVFSEKKPLKGSGVPDNTHFVKKFFILVLPAFAGIIIEFAVGTLLTKLIDFGITVPPGSNIALPTSLSAGYFVDMFYSIFRKLFLAGLWYFPIGLFVMCLGAGLVLFIAVGAAKKRGSVILCAAGTLAGLFGISILTGGAVKYRTCLSFAPFVAFVMALLVYYACRGSKPKALKVLTAVCATFMVAVQVVNLNIYFCNNDLRWEEEKAVLVDCCEKLSSGEYSIGEKPVIFIGEYTLSDDIMSRKFVRADDPLYKAVKSAAVAAGFRLETTDCNETYVLAANQADFGSVISWGIDDRFSCNEELLLVIKYLGYEFIPGTMERYEELSANKEAYPAINETGLATELDDCIVVRFK